MKLTGRVKGRNILYRSDCKEAIKNLISKGIFVDVIYLDPPFNSNRAYNIIYKGKGGTAQQKAFDDTWTYTSETQQMLEGFENYIEGEKEISDVIKNFLRIWIKSLSSMSNKDKNMIAYLVYMAERLVLMKKILKDTGSIYYHCDPTASHYIKIIMDGIFGSENFRNEIVWCYKNFGATKKHLSKKHDTILCYGKNAKESFHNPLKEKSYNRGYKKYGFSSSKYKINEFREKDCSLCERELPESKGWYTLVNMKDWWVDINPISRDSKEKLGYNTQKPVALLERVVKLSCPVENQNSIVLDPFCGCGTTVEAAHRLGVKWIGVDISINAIEIIKERLQDRCGEIKYLEVDGDPESRTEYDKLDAFKKQEFLVNKVGGTCNKKKTGDEGVDGEITVHLGEKDGRDTWGKMVISVKTGKQCKPEFVRELLGTMKDKKAIFGGLIIEADPSDKMEEVAKKQGKIKYYFNPKVPPQEYYKVQILTASEIIDKKKFYIPSTMQEIRLFRKNTQLGE